MGPLCLAPASFFPGCVATGLSRPMRPLLGPPPPAPLWGHAPKPGSAPTATGLSLTWGII